MQKQHSIPPRYRFSKKQRLVKSDEFDAVFAEKLSAGDRVLLLFARPNGLGRPRLGLVVSRKVGKAVRRNRWKRTLREAFRMAQHELPPMDFVVLPKSPHEPTLAAVDCSLRRLVEQIEAKQERRKRVDG